MLKGQDHDYISFFMVKSVLPPNSICEEGVRSRRFLLTPGEAGGVEERSRARTLFDYFLLNPRNGSPIEGPVDTPFRVCKAVGSTDAVN